MRSRYHGSVPAAFLCAAPLTAGPMTKDKKPRPQPPEKPSPDDCCRGGCDPCVFDLYAEALHRYRDELARWEGAQPRGKTR